MKIAIYNPYLDTVGGGEKYMMTIAEFFSEKEQVDILLDKNLSSKDTKELLKKIELIHGLNLSRVTTVKAPIGEGSSFIKRLFFLKKYDYIFYMTDGSIFLSTAKKSVLHFQLPIEFYGRSSLWNNLKLNSWKKVIYNSNFTKGYIEKSWPIKGVVVYPPVDVDNFKPLKKKKQILSVGRFTVSKKHQLIIKVFKELVKDNNLKGLSLHLAGGTLTGEPVDIDKLKKEAEGYPVYFYPDVSLDGLKKLLGESLIYWHAQGFEENNPIRQEHFGISTVEAMASGCIPIVVGVGGQTEIVNEGESGFLWNSLDEWKEKTMVVLKDNNLQLSIAKEAKLRSNLFSKENFCNQIKEVVYGSN